MKKIFLIGLVALSITFFSRGAEPLSNGNCCLDVLYSVPPVRACAAIYNWRKLNYNERKAACLICGATSCGLLTCAWATYFSASDVVHAEPIAGAMSLVTVTSFAQVNNLPRMKRD